MNLLNCQSSFCVTLEVKGSSNISILSLKPEADVSHGSDSKSSATQVMELQSTDFRISSSEQRSQRGEPLLILSHSFFFSGKLSKESQFSFLQQSRIEEAMESVNVFFLSKSFLSFFILDPILWKLRNPCCVGKKGKVLQGIISVQFEYNHHQPGKRHAIALPDHAFPPSLKFLTMLVKSNFSR